MERDALVEMALSAGISVVNTRFPRPAIIEPSKASGGFLFMPSIIADGDASMIQNWLTGLRAKTQEVA